jgi:CIC family chloride channel protein
MTNKQNFFNKFTNPFKKYNSDYQIWIILFLSAIIGIISGLGAILFHNILELSKYFFLNFLAGYYPQGPGGETSLFPELHNKLNRWVLLIIPAIGAGLGGIIVYWFAPEAEGHGTDAAIDAYHHKDGNVRGIVPIIKIISSALTIGSGGSAGREGPIAQIGSGFGSLLG